MAMAEIEVYGAGIFGLTVAWFLQKKGAKVRVIEKRHVGAGASGGVVGALAPHMPDSWNDKKQFQFDSLIATPAFWAEVDAISGLHSGYSQIGRVIPLADQREVDLSHLRVGLVPDIWQGLADWRVLDENPFPDWSPDSPTGFWVHETLSARILPAQACKSLARAFVVRGGEILEGTDQGRGADARIFCTGFEGLLDLSAKLAKPFGKGVKGQGALLDFDAGNQPQIYAGGLHLIPHANGTTAIGSTNEVTWQGRRETDNKLDDILDQARILCPDLQKARVLSRWAGVRPRGARRAPILGRHPVEADTYIANGGFKIGFGVAVKAGQVMADLILNGQADIPDSFSVQANLK